MKEDCSHEHSDCIDSRPRDGYRYRRYLCRDCGIRFTTIEIRASDDLSTGEHTKMYRGQLANLLTDKQCRSLLEQIDGGHRTLNLI